MVFSDGFVQIDVNDTSNSIFDPLFSCVVPVYALIFPAVLHPHTWYVCVGCLAGLWYGVVMLIISFYCIYYTTVFWLHTVDLIVMNFWSCVSYVFPVFFRDYIL
jgi:hypothetical protein